MKHNYSAALLALLMLGNSLGAMDSETESSEEETAQEESFWSAQLSGASRLLALGSDAVGSLYHTVQNSLEYDELNKKLLVAAVNNKPQEMLQLIKHPAADINYVSGDEFEINAHPHDVLIRYKEGGDFPIWLIIRMNARRNPCAFSQVMEILLDHEAALRAANKLTPFDDLLRAIFDENAEEVRRLSALVDDINGADGNGFTVLKVATLGKTGCIPLLCEHPNFDPNIIFLYKPDPELGAIPTCALLRIMLNNAFSQIPREIKAMQAVSSLAERGAVIHRELFTYLKGETGPLARHNKNNVNYCLLMALGIERDVELREFSRQTSAAYTRSVENLLCCQLLAIYGESSSTYGTRDLVLLHMRREAEVNPLFLTRVQSTTKLSETDNLKRPFKEYLMAELRNDWLIEPQEVNGYDSLGMTPLMWAAARGNLELAQFLIQFPALDLMKLDNIFGFSALHFAIRNGHTDMVRFLIELPGAHRTQKTRSGRSPYQLAQRCKRASVTAFLDDRNKRRLHLLKCLLVKTTLPLDIRKKIVSELLF